MKKYEIIAIVLVVLYVVTIVSNPLYTILLSKFYGPGTAGSLTLYQYIIASVQALLRLPVAIAVAVWLGYQAKKDGASTPIWTLVGLSFGVLGAILYLVLRGQKDRSLEVGQPRNI
jgi:hypothetical protein